MVSTDAGRLSITGQAGQLSSRLPPGTPKPLLCPKAGRPSSYQGPLLWPWCAQSTASSQNHLPCPAKEEAESPALRLA